MTFAIVTASPATAETFRFAFQSDSQGLDPHSTNETFSLGFLGNVYEALTRYDGGLNLQPSLATSWEMTSPTTWRVTLRTGVNFHNGNAFDADDVIFSWRRALTDGSRQKARAALVKDIVKLGDHSIEIVTEAPTPILMRELVSLQIMDKEWSEENGATEASNLKNTNSGYASDNANGTGPFRITQRQTGVKTVFQRFAGYWDKRSGGVDQIEFTPVKEPSTRVAALISGQVDMVYPVPVQDWGTLESKEGVRPLTGPEARTIFLGMDQSRDELLHSNVKGKNPFKDRRVRTALAHAIDLDAIKNKVMRGASTSAGLMVAPQINGFNSSLNEPYPYDLAKARRLLVDAGYAGGFEVTLDCPNDRYVNDEKICQAVVGMLAKAGIRVSLLAQPKSKYFDKVLARGGYDTSFYLLGWTPSSMDSHNVFRNILACQDKEKAQGLFNLGNFCNRRVDEITELVGSETDQAKRKALFDEGFGIVRNEVGYLPLHQQPLSWGVCNKFDVIQRADNVFDFRSVRLR